MNKGRDYKALIMVVDDNTEFSFAIELTLEMDGYKVWKAQNGKHALEELQGAFQGNNKEFNCLPDLILSDIMMPVMDGYQFFNQVRANPYLNSIPFIFLTAKLSNEDIRQGKELGVDDYIAKGAEPDDILASVRGKLKRIESRWAVTTEYVTENGSNNFEETKTTNQQKTNLILIFVVSMIFFLFSMWLGTYFE